MNYTFQELANFFLEPLYSAATITIVVTQEDGRTSYGRGVVNAYNQFTETFSGGSNQIFNDRIDPRGPGTYDDQPFAVLHADHVELTIQRTGANNYRATFTLTSWGNTLVVVDLSEARLGRDNRLWSGTSSICPFVQ